MDLDRNLPSSCGWKLNNANQPPLDDPLASSRPPGNTSTYPPTHRTSISMPGASDIGKSFGLKKGGPLITEVGAGSDDKPAAAASSPKDKLTKSLGAEARELLTGGGGDAPAAAPKRSSMLIEEVEEVPAKKEQPRKMIISELSSEEEDDAPPEETPARALSASTKKEFVASAAFDGARAGYVFKLGAQGTGYYLDGSDASKAAPAKAAPKAETEYKRGPGVKDFKGTSLDEISKAANEKIKNGEVGRVKSGKLELLDHKVRRDGDKITVSVKMPGRRDSKGVMLAVSGTDLYSDLTLRAEQYEQLRVQLPAVVDQDKVKAKFSKRSSTLNIVLMVVGEGNRGLADSIMAKKAKKAKAKKRAAGVTKASEEAQKEKEKVKIDDLKICSKCGGEGTYTHNEDIMGGLTGEKFTGLQRVTTTECPECCGEGYVNQRKKRAERKKANGGTDPEPEEEEEDNMAKLGLSGIGKVSADDAQVYADYKKNMDPEKRKEFEAKIAEARNAGAKPI
jgi:HSP20 family molecular chaperone IbpA